MLSPHTSAQQRRWAKISLTDQESAVGLQFNSPPLNPRVAEAMRCGVVVNNSTTPP